MALKCLERDPQRLLPLGHKVFIVLLFLADGRKHTYAILKCMSAMATGEIKPSPGTLYGIVARLLHQGLIREAAERPVPELDDARRRYYELTDLGKVVAIQESQRLATLVELARTKGLLCRQYGRAG